MNNLDSLRYPIGRFAPQDAYSADEISQNISRIESLPDNVEALAKSLTPGLLDTQYREGGWTARQVIHHLSDSHLNAYIRMKWTLTEDTPTIKAYDEKKWAETPDVAEDPMISIALLKVLHFKFVTLLRNIKPEDLTRAFIHSDTGKQVSVQRMIALYAWHGEHHLGHLKIVAAQK